MRPIKALEAIEKSLKVSPADIKKFIKNFHAEMRKGLAGSKGSLKMIPTYAERPTGKEKGSFLALDLGGTNFRVLALRLRGNRKSHEPVSEKFTLKKTHMKTTGKMLFNFIANSIRYFLKRRKMDIDGNYNTGFTFSFPVRQTAIDKGILMRWTKGFRAKGVEGRDVVGLMNAALKRKGLENTQVVALANDTVSTLVAKSYEDQHCDVGVILGTGTNACYSEKLSRIPKWKGLRTASGEMIINTEWGNFNKLKLTKYDKMLDSSTVNPKEQILEKMVSGMYLGEVARLVAKDLINKKILFEGKKTRVFNKRMAFETKYMSTIEGDISKNLSVIKALLKKLGIPGSAYTDRLLLQKICAAVSTRAARISAAAMASVITRMDPALERKHTIAVDGSVFEKHPGFPTRIRAAFKEIFGKKAGRIKLSLTKDASGRGAAILAAI